MMESPVTDATVQADTEFLGEMKKIEEVMSSTRHEVVHICLDHFRMLIAIGQHYMKHSREELEERREEVDLLEIENTAIKNTLAAEETDTLRLNNQLNDADEVVEFLHDTLNKFSGGFHIIPDDVADKIKTSLCRHLNKGESTFTNGTLVNVR
jgi:regulator of replication initiation timing